MIKLIVSIEFYLLKSWYFMVVWNWFINDNIYNYQMDYTTSLMLMLVLNAIQFKMSVNTEEWEYEPWMYLFFYPIIFGMVIFIAWIFKLILI